MLLLVLVTRSGKNILVKPRAGEMSLGPGLRTSREWRNKDGLLAMVGIM